MIKLPLKGTNSTVTIAPSKIIAVGLNYREHIKESVSIGDRPQNVPKEPVLFAKTPNVLIGPGEAIVIPALIKEYGFNEPRVDPECELAVIIGRRGRCIRVEDAFDHILGYTCFNDVSMRNIQITDPSGWFRGKSFDTFGPVGPVVVPSCALDPQKLALCSRINGVLKQQGNTQDMIFSVPVLVAYISKQFTLEEGDIIATGTPSGISPIHPGDTVDVEVEGIGILTNPVIEEGGQPTG
jgi:2-keto-4-pentenoate hydratase/2-oxohepta-3-ene-1,7-dioic acid hydratase in catechol pathway